MALNDEKTGGQFEHSLGSKQKGENITEGETGLSA